MGDFRGMYKQYPTLDLEIRLAEADADLAWMEGHMDRMDNPEEAIAEQKRHMEQLNYKIKTYNSLLGLSVADATGENMMKILPQKEGITYQAGNVANHRLPTIQWPWSDDTAMAIGLYRILATKGTVDQLELAKEFAKNAKADPQRGYGKGTARLLFTYLYDVDNWRYHSENWWGPKQGSKGNGSAMRDSIIGSFYGYDLKRVAEEARKSAEVTHFHDEAIAGSIAVAVAGAVATYGNLIDYWEAILDNTPAGAVRDAIAIVSTPEMLKVKPLGVVVRVGNGSKVTALDTVPFALWTAFQALDGGTFESALNSIIEVGGDTDTVGAMVGGIITNKVPPSQAWIDRTEPLPEDLKRL